MRLGKRMRKWRLKGRSLPRFLRREPTAWADVERTLRRRMRVYPNTVSDRDLLADAEEGRDFGQLDLALPAAGRGALEWPGEHTSHRPEFGNERRKRIISIHGQDVADEEEFILCDEQEPAA